MTAPDEPTTSAAAGDAPPDPAEEAFRRGLVLLYDEEDVEGAEAAWVTADGLGHAGAATHLGLVAFHERRDVAAAEAAYARGAERGDGNGAFHLGLLCEMRGDLEGAEAAFALTSADTPAGPSTSA